MFGVVVVVEVVAVVAVVDPEGAPIKTFPAVSTAAQNELDGHEIDVNDPIESIVVAFDHDLPLYVDSQPDSLNAMQNEEVGHDTELS